MGISWWLLGQLNARFHFSWKGVFLPPGIPIFNLYFFLNHWKVETVKEVYINEAWSYVSNLAGERRSFKVFQCQKTIAEWQLFWKSPDSSRSSGAFVTAHSEELVFFNSARNITLGSIFLRFWDESCRKDVPSFCGVQIKKGVFPHDHVSSGRLDKHQT